MIWQVRNQSLPAACLISCKLISTQTGSHVDSLGKTQDVLKILSVVKNKRKPLLLLLLFLSFSTLVSLNSWALWFVVDTFTLLVSINISTTFHVRLSQK